MCGRYTLKMPLLEVAAELGLDHPEFALEPRYNIAPTQRLPIVTGEMPRRLQLMRWGLVPAWAKDPSIGNKLINARAETLSEKPAFRKALEMRRCLVVADGFYEWKATPYGKSPQHIHLQTNGLLTFGGLWESWRDAEGKELRTFTIITTTPNTLMAEIHDRMPVIVPPEFREKWLDLRTPMAEIDALLVPLADGLLTAETVGNQVNSPRNEGPGLLDGPTSLF